MSNEKTSKINYTLITTIFIASISGAFYFGIFFGKNEINTEYHKIVKEKSILLDSIGILNDIIKDIKENEQYKEPNNLSPKYKHKNEYDDVITNPPFKINDIKPTQNN